MVRTQFWLSNSRPFQVKIQVLFKNTLDQLVTFSIWTEIKFVSKKKLSRASPWPPITTGSPARGNVVILWFMYIILIFKFNDFAGQNTQTFMTMPMTSVYWLQLRINIVLFRGTLRSSKWPLLTTLAGKKGCPSHVSGVTPLNKTLLRRSLPSTSMLTPSRLRTVDRTKPVWFSRCSDGNSPTICNQ